MVKNENIVKIYIPLLMDGDEYRMGEKLPMGLKSKDVTWHYFGPKKYLCLVTEGTEEEKAECERLYSTALRAELREKRCLIHNKKGQLIRCPDCNSCWNCTKCNDFRFSTNRPLSLDTPVSSEEGEDIYIDVPDEDSLAGFGLLMLDDMMDEIRNLVREQKGEEFVELVDMLCGGMTVTEMARSKGIARSTLDDKVKSLRKILEPYKKYLK